MADQKHGPTYVGQRAQQLYVGWSAEIVRPSLVPDVKVPSNYKNEDAITAYKDKMRASRDAFAQDLPGPASLSEILVLDKDGTGPIFKASGVGKTSLQFYEFLVEHYSERKILNDNFPSWVRANRASRLFALLAWDILSWPTKPKMPFQRLEPFALLTPDIGDPLPVFGNPFNKLSRDGEPEEALKRFQGHVMAGEEPLELGSPMADAYSTYRLCKKLGI